MVILLCLALGHLFVTLDYCFQPVCLFSMLKHHPYSLPFSFLAYASGQLLCTPALPLASWEAVERLRMHYTTAYL